MRRKPIYKEKAMVAGVGPGLFVVVGGALLTFATLFLE